MLPVERAVKCWFGGAGPAMTIYPAIDIRGGQCVRLEQGDYARETIFDADPVAVARRWVAAGAQWLHLVDLDGAKAGRPVNHAVIARIVQAAGVPCQVGGGIRTSADVASVLACGVSRVIIGTKAVQDRAWLAASAQQYPGQLALGVDARDGLVAVEGWLANSDLRALDLAKDCEPLPLAAIIYTDIARDGMLAGPNVPAMAEMARSVRTPVIASGGVSTAADILQLAQAGLAGAIVGRALYEGRVDLAELIALARR